MLFRSAKAQARAAAAGNGAGTTPAATADGGKRGGSKGSCYEWASSGTCRHGATCKFAHDGVGGGGSPAAKVKTEPPAAGGNAEHPYIQLFLIPLRNLDSQFLLLIL